MRIARLACQVARQDAVSFRDLTVAGPSAAGAAEGAAESLIDRLAKKIKTP